MNETIAINVQQDATDVGFGALDMTITLPPDANMDTFLDACERLAMALTYQPESWRNAIIDKSREYEHALNKEKHNA